MVSMASVLMQQFCDARSLEKKGYKKYQTWILGGIGTQGQAFFGCSCLQCLTCHNNNTIIVIIYKYIIIV